MRKFQTLMQGFNDLKTCFFPQAEPNNQPKRERVVTDATNLRQTTRFESFLSKAQTLHNDTHTELYYLVLEV